MTGRSAISLTGFTLGEEAQWVRLACFFTCLPDIDKSLHRRRVAEVDGLRGVGEQEQVERRARETMASTTAGRRSAGTVRGVTCRVWTMSPSRRP
jgi:hypothetical protein